MNVNNANPAGMIPVLIEVTGGEVHIQQLARTAEGLALNPCWPFCLLGTVTQANTPGRRGQVRVWRWESEGHTSQETTKATAIAAMLTDAGYVQATPTDTIPDLLTDRDGAA